MGKESGGIPVVSGPHVADLFADEAISFELINGTVRISLSSIKMVEPTPPSALHHVIVARLILGVPSAQRLAMGLFDYLRKQGLDPADLLKATENARN